MLDLEWVELNIDQNWILDDGNAGRTEYNALRDI